MDGLFLNAMNGLTEVVEHLSASPVLKAMDTQDELADTISFLHTRLIQLNSILFIEFPFEEGPPGDIIQYAALLKEYETECDEKVEYMFSRHLIFPDNSWDRYETKFLEEVLQGIVYNSNVISGLLSEK